MTETLTIAMAGDISLNDAYCKMGAPDVPSVFGEIRKFLDDQKVGALLANLESPMADGDRENQLKYPRLKTNEAALEALKTLKPHTLILANNHVYDCLEGGLKKTQEWLHREGIAYTGAYHSAKEASIPHHFVIGNQHFSLMSYVAADTHPSLPDNATVVLNLVHADRIVAEIRAAKIAQPTTVLIVSLHWGVEFSLAPSPEQRRQARSFVDAGADIIMGHHTHTLQGHETWKHGHIFYSLGNFAFADVRDCTPPVLWNSDQRHGGLALLHIKDGHVAQAHLHVSVTDQGRTRLETSARWKRKVHFRSRLLALNDSSYRRFWALYQFLDSVILPPFRYFFGERKNFFKQLATVRPRHVKKILSYLTTFISRTRKSAKNT